ncbi:hypothetical protein ALC57_05710, partial [Trachymyrmex cornetzi]
KQTNIREPIASHTRLQICLRYLASGDSMRSIGYAFRVSLNTVSQIIHETCDEIWLKLKDLVMPIPNKDAWTKIAENFEAMWNFPHCMGAIDGKHAPPHSGSFYYNYKKPQERQYLQYNRHDRQQTSLGIIRNIGNQVNQDVISRNLSSIYRERFANYFVNEGTVQWQWEKAENNEF